MPVYKSKAEIPTIDCDLITIEVVVTPAQGSTPAVTREFGFQTANRIQVEPQTDEQEAVRLIIKGKLKAQKKRKVTLTGNQITLTDNVFNPELVTVLQGGAIIYDQTDPNKIVGYNPPEAGSDDEGEEFTLNAYSAQYNAAGQIVNYEKISYPHCTGEPVAFGAEDGVFRAPEYVINSAADTGERPYTITYVDQLPTLSDPT